ncbi:hypothetical protein WBG78_27170 [Chryseolinea sp. T2]|uniref:hypothetical protein n=1 Tax=Chryseolinea sp. T2 TaxID=3129255 RepID=UPI003076EE7E
MPKTGQILCLQGRSKLVSNGDVDAEPCCNSNPGTEGAIAFIGVWVMQLVPCFSEMASDFNAIKKFKMFLKDKVTTGLRAELVHHHIVIMDRAEFVFIDLVVEKIFLCTYLE